LETPPPPPGVVLVTQLPTSEAETQSLGAVIAPQGQNQLDEVEAGVNTPPQSCDVSGDRLATIRYNGVTGAPIVTNETALNTVVVEAAPSIRSKILAARKAPEEVAQLMATQTEQLSVPVYKRLPDGAFWRVRSGGEWDPHASELLLLPRKDGGLGPEFLLVLPELEPLFQSDAKLRNLVRYHHLAFVVDSRGRVGWWAVPSRSDNDWHVSSRTALRRLLDQWGMQKSDQGAKSYLIEKPADNLGAPAWPAGSYDDWFVKGLSDKVIDSPDHPVLRELQGRK
jgi:hypothetical protein